MVDPNEPFTVAQFVEMADETIADAAERRPAHRHRRNAAVLQGAVRGSVRWPGADAAVPRSGLNEEPLMHFTRD